MKILSLICLLTLISCGTKKGASNKYPTEYANRAIVQSYTVYGALNNKRVILAHGMDDSASLWTYGQGLALKDGLVAQGVQVITFSYPNTTRETFYNGGLNYRRDFIAFMNWMLNDIDANHGMANETIMGGFSLGGLHSMIAASELSQIDRYFGMLPVTEPKVLFNNIETQHFNAFFEKENLSQKDGLIISGLQDTIVNPQLSIRFQGEVGAQGLEVNVDHRMNAEVVNAVLNWI